MIGTTVLHTNNTDTVDVDFWPTGPSTEFDRLDINVKDPRADWILRLNITRAQALYLAEEIAAALHQDIYHDDKEHDRGRDT